MPARNPKIIEEIRLRNRKGDPRTIKTLPGGMPKPKPKPKGSNMKSYDPMGAGLRTVKVRKGDNLTHIADRIGTTVAILKKLNPNVKPRYMDIGMKLLVPSGGKR